MIEDFLKDYLSIIIFIFVALAPSELLETFDNTCIPVSSWNMYTSCISIFLYIPRSPYSYIPKIRHPYLMLYPYTPIHPSYMP